MQAAKGQAELGRKAKLARSYQELLDEFAGKDLKSVGSYQLGRLIGKGSFGKVYLASHKLTNGSKVVLKSANKGDSNLAREIHHHRQFIHPHIARLYEVIVTENMVWMVLEYCAGDELYNHLLEHGPLPVPKVQKIFAQLVGAVSYVHNHSCVHRDLKLENILFDTHENVKLVDFGFTREYEGRTNHLQTFCGTICYSAPEMLKGERYAGEKVDVWSLGIILYALLCGELPFDDDDDNVTRTKILSEEPKYPDHLPPDAVPLIKALLSKRPLLRPSLPDVLAHPFLAEHAPAQRAILDIKPTAPFATALEKDCLHRMRSAGVNIDSVIESVIAQKCDALAGWWALLLEKEQRKAVKREKKRREREIENRSLRRLSAASSRLERIAPILHDVDEDGGLTQQFIKLEHSKSQGRGRSKRRSAHYSDYVVDLPQLLEVGKEPGGANADGDHPPPPIDKDSIRSVSTSRQRRPIPPPKEGLIRSARSRGSTLHLVTTSNALESNGSHQSSHDTTQKPKRKPSQAIISHWKNWTHWFIENTTRRKRGHQRQTSRSTPDLHKKEGSGISSKEDGSRPQTSKYPASGSPRIQPTAGLPKGVVANGHAAKGHAQLQVGTNGFGAVPSSLASPTQPTPRISSQSYKRQSLSPSPLTPRSTMRRSSAGLRGRKSTSSSVSSVRSIHHHHHSHSKASSTSSAASFSASMSKTPMQRGQSPHHSVKVLPATPTAVSFPSNIRLVRATPPPLNIFNEGMPSGGPSQAPGSPNPFSSGVMFAKRKRNLFKGPTLNFGAPQNNQRNGGSGSHSRSASASGLGRRSGEVTIQEEDEGVNEEEEEEVEEVEVFSPVIGGPGEKIEEQIFEEDETAPTTASFMLSAPKEEHEADSDASTIANANTATPAAGAEKAAA
ncbi:kinase-like domain-containing protein [Dactylonectria macrodidyma]|uniref:Kinase-like domain-containing protein n=1 Tax=Dactylonectria macrodidyma TaxID=307937 RepID=A0A9P9EAT0_9HYPO|nr:kinase-like domain-containing protein [Dactylonectria macrodidyma]